MPYNSSLTSFYWPIYYIPHLAEILNQEWPIMSHLRLAYQKLRVPEKESSIYNDFFFVVRDMVIASENIVPKQQSGTLCQISAS